MMVYKLLHLWRWKGDYRCAILCLEQVWSSNSFLYAFRGCKSLDRKKREREGERGREVSPWMTREVEIPSTQTKNRMRTRSGRTTEDQSLGIQTSKPLDPKKTCQSHSKHHRDDICVRVCTVIGKCRDDTGEGVLRNNGSSRWVTLKELLKRSIRLFSPA